MAKGSRQRPLNITMAQFDNSWDAIFKRSNDVTGESLAVFADIHANKENFSVEANLEAFKQAAILAQNASYTNKGK